MKLGKKANTTKCGAVGSSDKDILDRRFLEPVAPERVTHRYADE